MAPALSSIVVLAACGSALVLPRGSPAGPRLRAAAVGATADDEARVLALLGEGRVVLGREEAAELDALLGALAATGSAATADALDGDWTLLYTSKSAFDAANPLGRRVDGTTPGLEGILPGARGAAAASSSPIQRALTSLESVDISQTIDLAAGRVDQWVAGLPGGAKLRLSAAASYADGRVAFAFDEAYFDVAGIRLPYPVPFRLLGDEARGYLDTRYVSDALRVSTGNKGTTFVLRRKPPRAADS